MQGTNPIGNRRRFLSLVVIAGLAGCGTGSTDTPTTADRGTASDCTTTTADALVSVTQAADGLSAAAVTSTCDQVAVYSEEGTVRSVSISTEDGDTVVAEFDDDGQLVVARDAKTGDTVSASYNDGLGYARVSEDINDAVAASIVSIQRDDTTSARVASQNDDRAAFCSQLGEFAFIIADGCDDADPPARCATSFADSARAVAAVCDAERIETFEAIDGLKFGAERELLPLGIDGFVTTRPASDGTTFILTAVPFGGKPPYDITWSQESGEPMVLSQLPGGAAVGDSPSSSGSFGFAVDVTDGLGATTRTLVPINLGEEFIGVVAQASDATPAVGQDVEFFAAPRDTLSMFDVAQSADGIGTDYKVYWDFGDGTAGKPGETVTHAYAEPGVYTVSLIVVAGRCDFNDYLTIEVGGATADDDNRNFKVRILSGTDSLSPGGSTLLSPEQKGGVAPIEYAWGIIEGEEGVASFTGTVPTSGLFAFSEQVELVTTSSASRPIIVGVVAVDATGRVAEAMRPLPVCSEAGGLFASILGPFEVKADKPAPLDPFIVSCDGRTDLTYAWTVTQGSATLSDGAARNPELTATQPGENVKLRLTVTDGAGNSTSATTAVFVLLGNSGELFTEFLGPHQVPVGQEVPVFAFIAGGEPPYFCSWHVDNGPDSNGRFMNPFKCDPKFTAMEPGCLFGELRVEDSEGNFGVVPFEICSGEGFGCPADGFCDDTCEGFDPDCGDPCPFDGFCDEFCPIGDPDCFEGDFCQDGDGVCDPFCAEQLNRPDADCDHCGDDGVCVFFCPFPDPDCDQQVCVRDDGICDFGCQPPDPDCEFHPCRPDDGFCDFGCPQPDPDCPQSNDEICETAGFCCDFDGFCDPGCPRPDLDCDGCGPDGLCVFDCPHPDPDCAPCDPALHPDCPPCNPMVDPNCFGGGHCGDGVCDGPEDCHVCPIDCGDCQGCTTDAECDDFDPCTQDTCPADGLCRHDVVDPNCVDGGDGGGGPCSSDADCDDFDPCTQDTCPADGLCRHDVIDPNCVDGGDGGGGPCSSDADCDDFDPCTADSCPADGLCQHDTDPECRCGDGICEGGEDNIVCPEDCP